MMPHPFHINGHLFGFLGILTLLLRLRCILYLLLCGCTDDALFRELPLRKSIEQAKVQIRDRIDEINVIEQGIGKVLPQSNNESHEKINLAYGKTQSVKIG